jgi:hypothetical protein
MLEENNLEIDATMPGYHHCPLGVTRVELGGGQDAGANAYVGRPVTAGSLLVTLGLTDMPSYWAPSPATTAVVGAAGGGWHPSGDLNAIRGRNGKLKATVLICIEADTNFFLAW